MGYVTKNYFHAYMVTPVMNWTQLRWNSNIERRQQSVFVFRVGLEAFGTRHASEGACPTMCAPCQQLCMLLRAQFCALACFMLGGGGGGWHGCFMHFSYDGGNKNT